MNQPIGPKEEQLFRGIWSPYEKKHPLEHLKCIPLCSVNVTALAMPPKKLLPFPSVWCSQTPHFRSLLLQYMVPNDQECRQIANSNNSSLWLVVVHFLHVFSITFTPKNSHPSHWWCFMVFVHAFPSIFSPKSPNISTWFIRQSSV